VCAAFWTQTASAILDGRAAPIHLSTRYTFTDYEWARGNVYFHDGFDVAPGGTILLSVAAGFVNGDVALNGGTIDLKEDLTFLRRGDITGTGFIDMNNNSLSYNRLGGFFDDAPFVKILSPGEFLGEQYARMFLRNKLDLSAVTGEIRFKGGTLITGNGFITTTTNPSLISFHGVNILGGGETFLNPIVELRGQVIVNATNPISMQLLNISDSIVTINTGSRLQATGLNVSFFTSTILLRNAQLDFVSTGTSPIVLGAPNPFQGKVLLEGECSIESTTGNELRVNPSLDLEFLAGSRLIINNDTHLAIE
jgi:hypothetical protein